MGGAGNDGSAADVECDGGKLGVEETAGKKVIEQLSEHTAIEAVVSELQEKLPKE